MKNMFTQKLAVDMGTVNTRIAGYRKGIMLREPTVIAVPDDCEIEKSIIGTEAFNKIEHNYSDLQVEYPMRKGAVTDIGLASVFLKKCIKSALGRKSNPFGISLLLVIPPCVTDTEKKAMLTVAKSAGAWDVNFISRPLAAAMGTELPVREAHGSMIVDVGGGVTSAAVVTLSGVAVESSARIGGITIDDSIARYVFKEYGVIVGNRMAEQIKFEIGEAYGGMRRMNVRCREADTGLPTNILLDSDEIAFAISKPIMRIADLVIQTLNITPPELAGDVMRHGITLTGGAAALRGLDAVISRRSGLVTHIDENASDCSILGALRELDQIPISRAL